MAGPTRPYEHQRRWRNLLLDKRYQLRFTLFLVGLSAVLMGGLGIWVMFEVSSVTGVAEVNLNEAVDAECKDPRLIERAPAPAAAPAAPPSGPSVRDGVVVTIEEVVMPAPPAPPAPPATSQAIAAFEACTTKYDPSYAALVEQRRRVLYGLLATGLSLVVALTAYGLKMTHRVAGPLHKIGKHLDALRDGRYDRLDGLRRGDRLGEFYDHFRQACSGVRHLDGEDAARLRDALAAAEAAGLAARSPEIAAALDELRAIVARKEAALG